MFAENIGLVFKKGDTEEKSAPAMITDSIIDFRSWSRSGMQGGDYIAPAYLYTDTEDGSVLKSSNLNKKFIDYLYDNNIYSAKEFVDPIQVMDYIYASLHSPAYKEKYAEFLKIDFPRVPYPTDKDEFWRLVKIGTKLRSLHLMTDPEVNNLITTYPVAGDDNNKL